MTRTVAVAEPAAVLFVREEAVVVLPQERFKVRVEVCLLGGSRHRSRPGTRMKDGGEGWLAGESPVERLAKAEGPTRSPRTQTETQQSA